MQLFFLIYLDKTRVMIYNQYRIDNTGVDRMKSKQGFTMIELLAAIVIVGILASAGVVGVVNLRKNQEVKYNQTQNNMFIETAKTYFADNKQYLPTKPGAAENVYVTLGELMEANYITDKFLDYNGKEYDKDSRVQVLRIDRGVYTYRGSLFIDGIEVATTEKAKVEWKFEYKNKIGNLSRINNKNYTNLTPSMLFNATSKNGINLLAYMYTIYRNGVVYETSDMIYLGKKMTLNDELVLDLDSEKYSGDARYKIKITLYDESGYELTKTGEEIVIDTVPPKAPQLVNLYENKWINKSYEIKGTAYDSSGIAEWQHTYKLDAREDDWKKYKDSAKSSFTTTSFTDEMDKYVYIRVCDYANNCSEASPSKIKIDKTAPTCGGPTGGNPSWINAKSSVNERIITATCDDSKKGDTHSGCVENSISYTYSKDIDTKEAGAAGNKQGGIVRDIAGNTTKCKANQIVKIDKTAPTAPSLDNPNNKIWVNKAKFNSSGFRYTIKGTTKEKLSGVDYWQYTYNKDASSTGSDANTYWKTYENSAAEAFETTPFTAERNQDVYIRVCDKAGNCSSGTSNRIKIDRTDPECGDWSGQAPSSSSWAKTRKISVGCIDNLSKCAEDRSIVKEYSGNTVLTENLSKIISDNAGNTTTCSKNSVPIYIDNDGPSKPSIELFRSSVRNAFNIALGYASGNWSNTEVMTRAKSKDSGAGIAYYQYSHDGVGWSNSITSLGWHAAYYESNTRCDFWINWDGQWNFYVRAVDNAGNPGPASDMFTLRVDMNPPLITGLYNPTSGSWVNYDFNLRGTAEDAGSGIKNWQYTYNGNATTTGSDDTSQWKVYSGSATPDFTTTPFKKERNQNVYIRACDNVENCSNAVATKIQIDKTAPKCTNIAKKTDASGSKYKVGSVTCTNIYTSAKCSDSLSECSGVKTITTAGETTDVTNAVRDSWTVQAKGDSWVQWKVYDNAKNEGVCPEIKIVKGKKSVSSKCDCKVTKTCSGDCKAYSSWKLTAEDTLRRITGTTCESMGTTAWYTDCDISPTADGAYSCRCDKYTRYCTKRNKTNCGCKEYENCCHAVD